MHEFTVQLALAVLLGTAAGAVMFDLSGPVQVKSGRSAADRCSRSIRLPATLLRVQYTAGLKAQIQDSVVRRWQIMHL
jgi:hypothetical protein